MSLINVSIKLIQVFGLNINEESQKNIKNYSITMKINDQVVLFYKNSRLFGLTYKRLLIKKKTKSTSKSLELFWIISSTFCSKKVSALLPSYPFSKNPKIPFFSNVYISFLDNLLQLVLYPASLKCPPIKIALSKPNF